MEENIKVVGKTENNMVKVFISVPMDKKGKESGKKENVLNG